MARRNPLAVTRLDSRVVPAASLDPAFGDGGTALVAPADDAPTFLASAAVAHADGSVTVAGTVHDAAANAWHLGLWRLTADGKADAAFNGGEPVALAGVAVAAGTQVRAAAQADGKIVLAATTAATLANGTDVVVTRVNPDGTVDGQFGLSGSRVLAFDLGGDGADVLADLKVMPDGRIAVLNTSGTGGGGSDVILTVLQTNGALDPSFAASLKLNFGSATDTADVAAALAVATDGALTVVGTGGDANGVVAARVTNAGSTDQAFGTNGRVAVSPVLAPGHAAEAVGAEIDADGRLVILARDFLAGTTGVPGSAVPGDFLVTRLTPTGAVDAAFGQGGATTVAFAGADGKPVTESTPADLVTLADGRLIATGTARTGEIVSGDVFGVNDFAVAYLAADGSVTDAAVVRFDATDTPLAQQTNDVATTAVLTDDGLVVIGNAGVPGTGGAADTTVLAATRVLTAEATSPPPATTPPTSPPPVGDPDPVPTSPPPATTPPTVPPPAAPTAAAPAETSVFPALRGVPLNGTTGDVNGDGVADYIYTSAAAAGAVRVYDGKTGAALVGDLRPYEPTFRGGLNVAAGDVDGDGDDEVVVSPVQTGSARVQVFTWANGGLQRTANFFAIGDANWRGGATVAVGDFNADGKGDLAVGAGYGGGPRAAVYDGTALAAGRAERLVNDFYALPDPAFRGGVTLAAGDFDGDGRADLAVGAGAGGSPRVRVLSGGQMTAETPDAGVLADFLTRAGTISRAGVKLAVRPGAGGKYDLVTTDDLGQKLYAAAAGPGESLPGRVRR